ncbi:MAG TPA: hypothetical protein GXZ90_10285 [Clostridiales bacterium]|nr:hypothetical protein [Clostridiales bacterium]
MLGKLFKHEFKATSRLLLPLYSFLLILAIINRIFIEIDLFDKAGFFRVINTFTLSTFIISIIVILIATQLLVIYRFYKNLTTNEGYLMFTLPVKTHELINSKLIVLVIWTILSFLSAIIALSITFLSKEGLDIIIDFIKTTYNILKMTFDAEITILIIETIILLFTSIIFKAISIYLAIAIGQAFTKNKILSSIAAFIGINIIIQFLTSFSILAISFIFDNSVESINSLPNILLPASLIISIILGGVQYYLTNYFLSKKLNLE